jgi:hypothetical protein
MDKEGNEITLIDILGTESDDVADKVQLKIEKSKIYKNLDILDDREKEVVIGRFGSSSVMRWVIITASTFLSATSIYRRIRYWRKRVQVEEYGMGPGTSYHVTMMRGPFYLCLQSTVQEHRGISLLCVDWLKSPFLRKCHLSDNMVIPALALSIAIK